MDWKHYLISTERLCEIFRVPYYDAYTKLRAEYQEPGQWFDIMRNSAPAERIEELLLT